MSSGWQWDLTPNQLSERIAALRRAGVPLLDLTESNPTRCGLRYPDGLVEALADPRNLQYEPSPTGLRPAREAVAALYAAKGLAVSPDRILLTASTSEAYSLLWQAWGQPGDQIVVPRPSYPLLDYLAGLHHLKAVTYPWRWSGRWSLDRAALARAVTPTTRALVVVHPNNPTGACVTRHELADLVALCRQHRMVLVADEVFAEYLDEPSPAGQRAVPALDSAPGDRPSTLLGAPDVVTVALGGLSKFMGLPQMKLAWMAVSGPEPAVAELWARLEVVADTYLSVNTPVQQAWPAWRRLASAIQQQIRERIAANRRTVRELTPAGGPVECLPADGGWSAVLRAPFIVDEEAWVLELLEREQVVVHPGYFFDFEESGYLVVSLLPPPAVFRDGLTRLLRHVS